MPKMNYSDHEAIDTGTLLLSGYLDLKLGKTKSGTAKIKAAVESDSFSVFAEGIAAAVTHLKGEDMSEPEVEEDTEMEDAFFEDMEASSDEDEDEEEMEDSEEDDFADESDVADMEDAAEEDEVEVEIPASVAKVLGLTLKY